jgi:nicotinamide-nucleotide amidase
MQEVESLAIELGAVLKRIGKKVAFAESCTGGAVCHIITNVPGSSEYFLGGVVAYSDHSKVKLLGVSEDTLKKHGAVSAETVSEMAAGVREYFESDIGISISGIAGPGGGSPEKPVGTVYVGIDDGEENKQYHYTFQGDRLFIKRETLLTALELIIERYGSENTTNIANMTKIH